MRLLFGFLAVLLVGVVAGLLAYEDPGYVLIGRGNLTIETTLSLFLVLLLAAFAAGYALVRLIVRAWTLPERLRHWRAERRRRRARRSLRQGLIELAEGHWRKAERILVRHARDSSTPLLNYLSAARAAQKQDAPERRDHYLAEALKSMPDADVAVELTQAELQLAHGQLEQALATLEHLRAMVPNHAHVLLLLAQVHERLQSWEDLRKLLPLLRKHKVLEEKDWQALAVRTWRALLARQAESGDAAALQAFWKTVPKELRGDRQLLTDYIRALMQLGEDDSAEPLLREGLRQHWDPEWVRLYGELHTRHPERQLAVAEEWLKGHENNAMLLLTLGRICLRNQLWGKARSYLEASLGSQPLPETWRELGLLLERLDEPEAAAEAFKQGLLLATGGESGEAPSAPAQPARLAS